MATDMGDTIETQNSQIDRMNKKAESNSNRIKAAKYTISTPLMIENPENRPKVPPITDNFVSKFAFSSFVILSNVGVA